MHIALAVLLALHGAVHGAGFYLAWRLAPGDDIPYGTTALAGRVDLGAAGSRALGVLWLAAALAFQVVALGIATGRAGAPQAAVALSLVSLLLSIVGLPASRVGIPVNLAIIAMVLAGSSAGWW